MILGSKARRAKKAAERLAVWMHPVEFSQLVAVVEATWPRRVLEWGSGGSTRAMLERFPFIERYVSIEHDTQWSQYVHSKLDDPRLELHNIQGAEPEPDDNKQGARRQFRQRAEVEPEMFADYVAFPATLGERFDLVLVDGRARCFCLAAGFELLVSGGVLVLHDAQRREYHQALHALGRPVFLEPWQQGQICLVRKP